MPDNKKSSSEKNIYTDKSMASNKSIVKKNIHFTNRQNYIDLKTRQDILVHVCN